MDAEDELELQTTDDPNIQDYSASYIPVVARKMTEEESIRKFSKTKFFKE